MPRYDTYPALSEVSVDDKIVVLDASTGQNKIVTQRDLVGISDFGWTATGEDWTYSSYNATTKLGVITVPSGATTKYSVGMAVRFAQPTDGTKYGRIRAVTSTTLTVYMAGGGDLDNEAITDAVYSSLFAPLGMPEADRSVTASKLATGAATATVDTNESTTSTSYTNLTTVGPSVTLTVPSTGMVLISFSANVVNTAAGNYVGVALEMSGANSLTATDFATTTILGRIATSNQYQGVDRTILLTGLNAGSTTFILKYKTNAGTAQARERSLSVVPLG